MTTQSFDGAVRKHCGRMSLSEQAKTGFYSTHALEKSFDTLYRSPEIQRMFGVEKLAFTKGTALSVLAHTDLDRKIGETDTNLDPSRTYTITESKPRQSMWDADGNMRIQQLENTLQELQDQNMNLTRSNTIRDIVDLPQETLKGFYNTFAITGNMLSKSVFAQSLNKTGKVDYLVENMFDGDVDAAADAIRNYENELQVENDE
jgi:hypothetical protein